MNTKALLLLGLFAFASIITIAAVSAEPVSPTQLTPGTSERGNVSGTQQNVSAEAGNVTRLDISASELTKSWQGYFGNITGQVILADASGNQLYNWSGLASPTGEVYASRNSTIDWASINCSTSANMVVEQTALGQTGTDSDRVNNTFTSTAHPTFFVGSVNATGCPSTTLFNSTGSQSTFFWNVLLSDTDNSTVYTTIIDNDEIGFNDEVLDFQMIVGEDGHGGAASTVTPYFFWIELS